MWKVKEFIKGFWTLKYDFFQKIKIDVMCLKNSFRQIKHTSYRYFWTGFHYGISGFEYRNPSKIRCREKRQISVLLKKMLWKSFVFLKCLQNTDIPGLEIFEGFRYSKPLTPLGKLVQKYRYDVGFIWRKLFLRHLEIDFNFLKKSYLLVQNPLINSLTFHKCKKMLMKKLYRHNFWNSSW